MDSSVLAETVRRIKAGTFHQWWQWRKLAHKVISEHHNECIECKRRGTHARAVLVHHDKPVKDYPELALCEHWTDEQGRKHLQLWPLCFDCHERIETERGTRSGTSRRTEYLTRERF